MQDKVSDQDVGEKTLEVQEETSCHLQSVASIVDVHHEVQ